LDLPSNRKLVLLALCERADLRTGKCFPSRDEIALRASLTGRNTSPHLKALEDAGYIRRSGRRPTREGETTTRYVNVERILSEGRARLDWFQELRRARRRLRDESSPGAWDELQSQIELLNPESEPGDESSFAEMEPGDVDDMAGDEDDTQQGMFATSAGDEDGSWQGTMATSAGDAATPGTVIEPSDQPSTEPSWEPSDEPSSPPLSPSRGNGLQEMAREHGDLLAAIRQGLRVRVTASNYETWLRNCRFSLREGVLFVQPPTELSTDWIRSRLKNIVAQAAAEQGIDEVRVVSPD